MGKKDSRVDEYIDKAQPFAKPILKHLRKVIHSSSPEIEETIKWGSPHFGFKGMVCFMAGFKAHCTFGFWKGALLKDTKNVMKELGEGAMGHFGKITNVKDLPNNKIMFDLIKQAIKLNEEGVKLPSKPKPRKEQISVPTYLKQALGKNIKANEVWKKFSYTNQKDYVEWLTEAKNETTRNKRLATAMEWIADGKGRNWKYM